MFYANVNLLVIPDDTAPTRITQTRKILSKN